MVLALLNALLSVSLGWSAGFFAGNTFEATTRVGEVKVRCHDRLHGARTVDFACRQSRLAPVESDIFVGPAGVSADKVKLVSIAEDGSRHTREESYDGRAGRSRDRFNLWRQTLLQQPLLEGGVNKITYALMNRRDVVTQGDFTVTVHRQNTLRCSDRTIDSDRMSDCENQITACDLYFSQANNCH